MKTSSRIVFLIMVLGFMIIGLAPVFAQCSQCAAQVATNSKNGGTAANGLNNGILFLLAAPYLAVAIVGWVWYKKYRRKNVTLEIRNEKLHLN